MSGTHLFMDAASPTIPLCMTLRLVWSRKRGWKFERCLWGLLCAKFPFLESASRRIRLILELCEAWSVYVWCLAHDGGSG